MHLQFSANAHLGAGSKTQQGFRSSGAACVPTKILCSAGTCRSTLQPSLMLCWTRAHWTRSCVGTRQTTMWMTCCRRPAGGCVAIAAACPTSLHTLCVALWLATSHTTDHVLGILEAVLKASPVLATAGCSGQAGASSRSHTAALAPGCPV